MYRASDLLQSARIDRDLSIDEISKKLKVKNKYLQAIEDENIANFPQEPYISLIVTEYAQFLGLNGERILSIFRRDFDTKTTRVTPIRHSFIISPDYIFKYLVIGAMFIFASYLFFEYWKYNLPPKLKVLWPPQGEIIQIEGETDSENSIRVNDDLIIVDQNGHFKDVINIKENKRVIIEAKSPAGKVTIDEKIYN